MIWSHLWDVQIPVAEKVIRTVAVYGGLAVLLRFGGKRELAQLNSFDLVVVLLLSNVVQNAVIGNDNSLSGGLLGAAVLVAVNAALVRVVNRHPTLTRAFEGSPTVVVERGKLLRQRIRRLGLREADVIAVLRRQGADDLSEVERATLAPGGSIVVTLDERARDVTRDDLAGDHQRLVADIRAELQTALAGMEQRLRAEIAGLGR